MASGIYEILNTANGKRYVGSAANFEKRWYGHRHLLNAGRHHNRYLQSSWSKHGEKNFQFRKVLICAKRDLLFYEQLAIDGLDPEYNVERTAGSSIGCIRTPETRAKIAARAIGRQWTEQAKIKLSATLSGRKMSDEFKQKLTGNQRAKGLKHTAEWKAANSALHIGRKRPKSPEYRAKIAATLRGRKATTEHRANQSAAQMGKKKGPYKPMSQETRDRISEARKGRVNPLIGRKRPADVVQRMADSLRGRSSSAEKKRKISASSSSMWRDPIKRAVIIEKQKAGWAARKLALANIS